MPEANGKTGYDFVPDFREEATRMTLLHLWFLKITLKASLTQKLTETQQTIGVTPTDTKTEVLPLLF